MIKHVLVGNILNSDNYAILNLVDNSQTDKICKNSIEIYKQACTKFKDVKDRKSLRSLGGMFFYRNYQGNFCLIFTEPNLSDLIADDILDELYSNSTWKMIEKNSKSFNYMGIKTIKDIINKFDESVESPNNSTADKNTESGDSRVSNVQLEIDGAKEDMKKNIKQALINANEVQILDEKSIKIKDGSEKFRNSAAEYRKLTWWQGNMFKFFLIGVLVIIGLILVIWAFS